MTEYLYNERFSTNQFPGKKANLIRRISNGLTLSRLSRLLVLWALTFTFSASLFADEDRYLVEVLVFHHKYPDAEPSEVQELRIFSDVFEFGTFQSPPVPIVRTETATTFKSIEARLNRLDDYVPLAVLSWEQTQIDYHPPVRVHNDEIVVEQLHFPSPLVYIDLRDENIFEPYLHQLYRLDGSVQLRRSRFLHVKLDLEFRIDNPAWADAAPLVQVEPGEDPAEVIAREESEGDLFDMMQTLEETPPEPFKIYRLQQERQIQTDRMHYFDTAYLGALVRITALEAQ